MRLPAPRLPSMTPAVLSGGGLAAIPLCLLLAAAGPAGASPPLFQAPFLSFDAGGSPVAVAVGDLNGDGKPDLVVANNGSSTVSVFLGNGDLTLGPRS
ncbi:MAG: VCBS repeat-containing protein, partial [Candidatus Eisenbacteria bacterium]